MCSGQHNCTQLVIGNVAYPHAPCHPLVGMWPSMSTLPHKLDCSLDAWPVVRLVELGELIIT